jgi:hypothetical protein
VELLGSQHQEKDDDGNGERNLQLGGKGHGGFRGKDTSDSIQIMIFAPERVKSGAWGAVSAGALTGAPRRSILKPWHACASPTIREPPRLTEVPPCNLQPAGQRARPLACQVRCDTTRLHSCSPASPHSFQQVL